ncbi:alkaline phosphatase, tissue-nonspecific isozyme-like [Scylla paramamosain]|uniref:alkaline phosphatase, tissue-nonspecific isozyme-like n=1 Tax=Scylla paramamosain TaxID=85552 RepID=UPI0030829AD2
MAVTTTATTATALSKLLLLLLLVFLLLQSVTEARVPSSGASGKQRKRHTDDEPDHAHVLGRGGSGARAPGVRIEDSNYWYPKMQQELKDQLAKSPLKKQAKNIIFFLGDGTSISTLTAARLHKGYKTGRYEHEVMAYEKFPYSTLIKTYSADKMVTDSAASATAYLNGVKGNQATIGVDARVLLYDCDAMNRPEYHTTSILTDFQNAGKSTGIVTTTRVTHASPAGTYAHTAERHWENDDDINDEDGDSDDCDDIAEQLVLGNTGSKIKVILGGGRKKFTPKGVDDPEEGDGGRRDDGKDLIQTWINHKRALGNASYVWHRSELMSLDTDNTDYLMGLFDWSHMSYAVDEDSSNPSLEEMTRTAIQILSRDPSGFFLFVEGGLIDRAHHLNEYRSAVEEALEFEKAIEAAVSLTDPEETLIIMTADHSQPLVINGYQDRRSDVLDIADYSDVDGLPYTTLLYTNGPGYRGEVDGSRPDPSEEDISDPHYLGDSAVPMISSNHGGEEVILYASGPHAHLFTGIHENAFIPHALRYAACVGKGIHFCDTKEEEDEEEVEVEEEEEEEEEALIEAEDQEEESQEEEEEGEGKMAEDKKRRRKMRRKMRRGERRRRRRMEEEEEEKEE